MIVVDIYENCLINEIEFGIVSDKIVQYVGCMNDYIV